MDVSIGIPVYDDFRGLRWTIQSIRCEPALKDAEIVVVNNNPSSDDGQRMGAWLKGWIAPSCRLNYLEYDAVKGTAPAKNKVMEIATGDLVCCIDAHVKFLPGAIESLLAYFDSNPDSRNLIQGPLVYDDLKTTATHFADVWRGGMWGIWERDVRGDGSEPFEIGAQGMGLFACRRKAWLSFNSSFTEFGPEEWYIHEKFRQSGAKCICIPQLRWWHDFRKGGSIPYPASTRTKIRNYVIGMKELGLSLDRARRHFVEGLNEDGSTWDDQGTLAKPQISAADWEKLVSDPSPQADKPAVVTAPAQQPVRKPVYVPGGKPGDELESLLHSVGLREGKDCQCKAKASMMNQMGVSGCKSSRHQLAGMLRDEADRRGIGEKFMALGKSVQTGLLSKIGLSDPYLGLIDEAVKRAEEKLLT